MTRPWRRILLLLVAAIAAALTFALGVTVANADTAKSAVSNIRT